MIKIAVLKPHHGPVGGFERVVARVEGLLTDVGYDVTRHSVDMTGATQGRSLASTDFEAANYFYARDHFDGIATSVYDLVISTSPPSYTHRHPAHLALFYHHHRVFYDLEDLYIEAGFTVDPAHHRAVASEIRSLDLDRLRAIKTFLSPSQTVGDRLARFNDRSDTMAFQAGIGIAGDATPLGLDAMAATRGVVCVTRHEFPKRPELLVAAAQLVDPTIAVSITGKGGRLGYAENLDALFAKQPERPTTVDPRALWCHTGVVTDPVDPPGGRVAFVGHVGDAELDALYSRARCIVAPAYDEDYGLTAIEAMARARPVVVCSDGGGLAELVTDGETGLVVEPEPRAIADAIQRLHDDVELAERLGRNGFERARELTWDRAGRQLLDAVHATLDNAT